MRLLAYCNLFVILCLTFFCLSGNAHAQSEDALMHRIERLERDMQTMQAATFRSPTKRAPVDNRMAPDLAPSSNGSSLATLEVRVTQLEERIKDITGKIEQLEHRLSTTNSAAQGNVPSTAGTPPTDTFSGAGSAASAVALYDQGFSYLQQKQYGQAQTSLQQFLTKYPKHDLASNALYWLGESYYAEAKYQQASIEFLKNYEQFPKGNKAPDSLLKLAISLSALKKEKEACATLEQLHKVFPQMNDAVRSRADSEASSLKCSTL